MRVTLSERRLSERIKQLEGINDNVEEITYRMEHYAMRLFAHVNEYGVRFVGMVHQSGGLGTFQFDISGVGRDWQTSDFNWQKLAEGLSFMDPVAVTVEESDMSAICTGLVLTMAVDNWEQYAAELQRISVGEIQPKIEAALLRLHNQPREVTSYTGDPQLDAQFREDEVTAQFWRAGVEDPLAPHKATVARQQAEEAAYAARERAAYEERWGDR